MMNEWIISSSLLIIAVVLVRAALRGKISLRLRYALWALVLVRLLVPVQLFTSDFGVGSMAQDVDLTVPARRVYTAARSEEYRAEYEAVYQQLQEEYAAMDQTVTPESIDKEASSRVEQSRSLDVSRILYGLWLGGMAVLSLVLIVCNGRFALRLRRSRREVAVNVLLPVYESALVPTPCIFGVFSPAIYLTPEVAEDEKARGHVLAHELTHYRHFDHIWSVLRCVCLVLHWYNPLVWLAFRLSREDAELACDEGALEILGEAARGDYGRTLIRLTCGEKLSTGLIAATTMTGSARSIARRLKTLTRRRRTTVLALIAVIVAAVIAVGCTFAGAPEGTGHDKAAMQLSEETVAYPGTAWSMTPEEVKAALDLKDEDCHSYYDGEGPEGYPVYAFTAENQTLLGVPVKLNFGFLSYTEEGRTGLCTVDVELADADDYAVLLEKLTQLLGSPVEEEAAVPLWIWRSEHDLSEYADEASFEAYLAAGYEDTPASQVTFYGPGTYTEPKVVFSSNLTAVEQLASAGQNGQSAAPTGELPLTVDGVIVYPGTSWNMTPEEVKAALNLKNEDCLTYVDEVKAANYAVYGFEAKDQTFLGFPVTLNFEFRALTRELRPGLCAVKVIFETERDLADAQAALRERLGAPAAMTSGVMSAEWVSEAVLTDFIDRDFWTQWDEYGDGSDPASRLLLWGPGVSEGYELQFTSNLVLRQLAEQGDTPDDDMSYAGQELPIPDFTEPGDTDVVSYFNTLLNPALYRSEADWYPRALTSFYDDPTQIDLFQLFYSGIPGADNTLSEAEKRYLKELPGYFPELDTVRIPAEEMDRVLKAYFGITLEETAGIGLENFLYIEGQDCYYHNHSDSNLSFWVVTMVEEMGDDVWRVKYERNPDYSGSKSPGAITLRLVEDQWQVLSNVSMEGELTSAQIDQVNAAFEPYLPMPGDPNGMVGNPICCFFTSHYTDVRELDLVEFLRYCPLAEPATEEEYKLLQKQENFPYTGSFADMPVPLHRYKWEDVDDLLKRYTGLGLRDRYEREEFWPGLYYLPETNCFYNTTSDAGIGMFHCIGGQIFEGSAELYSGNAVLILREEDGKYYIESHMPLERGTALTDEQIQQVRSAFAIVGPDGELNPLASMVNQYYTSPEQMDLEALIAYFPADGVGTEEEYALFQAAYPDEFPEWPTLADCPLPMHRYNVSTIDGVLRRYANITLDDLAEKTGYYLEEMDCYYNFTSDMGLEGFHCVGGEIYDDGVILYSNRSTLGLKMLGDQFVIDYHLPLEKEG